MKKAHSTPRFKGRTTIGDHKLASTVALLDTKDCLSSTKKVLGDVSNTLQNPSTSIHKKKKAAKDLDAITASLDVAMEKIGHSGHE